MPVLVPFQRYLASKNSVTLKPGVEIVQGQGLQRATVRACHMLCCRVLLSLYCIVIVISFTFLYVFITCIAAFVRNKLMMMMIIY